MCAFDNKHTYMKLGDHAMRCQHSGRKGSAELNSAEKMDQHHVKRDTLCQQPIEQVVMCLLIWHECWLVKYFQM